jgi:hypothetical protein
VIYGTNQDRNFGLSRVLRKKPKEGEMPEMTGGCLRGLKLKLTAEEKHNLVEFMRQL